MLTEVKYKRLVALENYENEAIELTATVDVDPETGKAESATQVFSKLKATAERLLGIDSVPFDDED